VLRSVKIVHHPCVLVPLKTQLLPFAVQYDWSLPEAFDGQRCSWLVLFISSSGDYILSYVVDSTVLCDDDCDFEVYDVWFYCMVRHATPFSLFSVSRFIYTRHRPTIQNKNVPIRPRSAPVRFWYFLAPSTRPILIHFPFFKEIEWVGLCLSCNTTPLLFPIYIWQDYLFFGVDIVVSVPFLHRACV
jgi:hypothetical protein